MNFSHFSPTGSLRIKVTQNDTVSSRIEKVGFSKRILLALRRKRYTCSSFQLCIPRSYPVLSQLHLGSWKCSSDQNIETGICILYPDRDMNFPIPSPSSSQIYILDFVTFRVWPYYNRNKGFWQQPSPNEKGCVVICEVWTCGISLWLCLCVGQGRKQSCLHHQESHVFGIWDRLGALRLSEFTPTGNAYLRNDYRSWRFCGL